MEGTIPKMLSVTPPPFSTRHLGEAIRRSSNFNYADEFFLVGGVDPLDARGVSLALRSLTQRPECHAFLRRTYDPINWDGDAFQINPAL